MATDGDVRLPVDGTSAAADESAPLDLEAELENLLSPDVEAYLEQEDSASPKAKPADGNVLDEPRDATAAAMDLDELQPAAATAIDEASGPTLPADAAALEEAFFASGFAAGEAGQSAVAVGTALDEPSGLTVPAVATALDDSAASSTSAAMQLDEPLTADLTGTQEVPAVATALDQPTATTAAPTAIDAVSAPTAATAVDQPSSAAAAAPATPGAQGGTADDSVPNSADDYTEEQLFGDNGSDEEVEDILGELRDMREQENNTEPAAAPAQAGAPAADQAANAGAGAASEPGAGVGAGGGFVDESRYMRDEKDQLLHKWKVDYATRGGAGKAMCRDLECLERHAQGGVRSIEKGELRMGRRVLMDGKGEEGHVVIMWYHARCIFNTFIRARKTTRVIQTVDDIEGFDDIQLEDQNMLRGIISGNEDVRMARNRAAGPRGGAAKTPEKRGPPGGEGASTPAGKRLKEHRDDLRTLRKGDRVWTHCRVKGAPSDRPGAAPLGEVFAVKSPKPELGMIAEEVVDDTVVVQFESSEQEKQRVEQYLSQDKRLAKVKAWLRYPRIFEGKKQRLPINWVLKKPPPKLCGCVKQEWAHSCDCGISCTRGTSTKVWGVCQ